MQHPQRCVYTALPNTRQNVSGQTLPAPLNFNVGTVGGRFIATVCLCGAAEYKPKRQRTNVPQPPKFNVGAAAMGRSWESVAIIDSVRVGGVNINLLGVVPFPHRASSTLSSGGTGGIDRHS